MKYQDFFETKGESEENTYEIIVSPEMSPENVAQKILETVNYTAWIWCHLLNPKLIFIYLIDLLLNFDWVKCKE